ncbi:hypothetical protein HYU09_03900 [Candidatus Woesearchaeota archaeon]|nr:hypothetical protein [Candidatus Woesearchaeota archaeon]
MRIKIISGNFESLAELKNTATAKAIYGKLPIESTACRWGDEVYFEIPVSLKAEEDAKEIVEKGDIAYWPDGRCFCIFFGRTPASSDERPKAASKVNVFGRIMGNYGVFRKINDEDKIIVDKA